MPPAPLQCLGSSLGGQRGQERKEEIVGKKGKEGNLGNAGGNFSPKIMNVHARIFGTLE